MRVGGFYVFAGSEFPGGSLRNLRPGIHAAGLRGEIDNYMIPCALRQELHREPDAFTVFAYCGGFDGGDLQVDDIEKCIETGLTVDFKELALGCEDYHQEIGHKPLIYIGSVRRWLSERAGEPIGTSIAAFIDLLKRRVSDHMAGFVYDASGDFKLGDPGAALIAAAMAAFPQLEHWGEPRQTTGSMASVASNFPCMVLAGKWINSGGSFGNADHVSLPALKAARCNVAIIESTHYDGSQIPQQYYVDQMKMGVGLALGHSTRVTAKHLKMLATAGTGGIAT